MKQPASDDDFQNEYRKHPPLKCRVGVKRVYIYYQAERAVIWHQAGEDTQLEEYIKVTCVRL